MTVLVTGGAGYIGSHAVRALQQSGYPVIILDNLVYGHKKTANTLGTKLIEGQVGDRKLLSRLLRGELPEQQGAPISAVMHFAAYAYVGESTKKPLLYYRNNVGDSLVLLETIIEEAKRRDQNPIPMVFSSTCATYGMPSSTEIPINEECSQSPINPYGRSKLMIEEMIEDLGKASDLPYVIFRYFNAAGAHPDGDIGELHNPETHLIPLVLNALTDPNGCIEVYGNDYNTRDGTCIRDYIHVCDLADAHVLGLNKLSTLKRGRLVYNLGNGKGYTVKEVIETVEKVTEMGVPISMKGRREGDPPILVASSEKARQELGWQPKFPDLATMIEHAWKWHKKTKQEHRQ